MKRPTGISVLAIVNLLVAGVCARMAFPLLMGSGHAATGRQGGTAPTWLEAQGVVGGVVLVVFAAIFAATSVGLWKLRNWARILFIVFGGYAVVESVLDLPGNIAGHDIQELVSNVFRAGVYVWVVWYLLRPHVKQAFGVSSGAASES